MRICLLVLFLSLFGIVLGNRRRPHQYQEEEEEDVIEEVQSGNEKMKHEYKDQLHAHINKLNKERKIKNDDDDLDDEQRKKLEREEHLYQKALEKAVLEYGEMSEQKANALHKLGRVVYKLKKYNEALTISKTILKIYENIHGYEDIKTSDALSNVGSVAYRLQNKDLCEFVMQRALYIIIKTHGLQSKEVLLHRGRLLTFQIANGKTSKGLSYEDAVEQFEHIYDEL